MRRTNSIGVINFLTQVTFSILPRSTQPAVWRELEAQIHEFGTYLALLVLLVSGTLGYILAFVSLQVGGQFQSLFIDHLPTFLGYACIEQVVPLLTAFLVIGRGLVASSADLASMRAEKEVDALEAQGVSPFPLLAGPRILALLITVPILTFVSLLGCLIGGWLGLRGLGVQSFVFFSTQFLDSGTEHAFFFLLAKALVSALVMGYIGSYFGLMSDEAARGEIGVAVKRTVTWSILAVTGVNLLFTVLAQFNQ